MKKLKNKEKITCIEMHPTAYLKCQLGQDWYKSEYDIHFVPGECYPDYTEVQEFIAKDIDGRELNIEEALGMIYDKLLEEYNPEKLSIICRVHGCKTHFDVEVLKE